MPHPCLSKGNVPAPWAASLLAPRNPRVIRGVSKLTAHQWTITRTCILLLCLSCFSWFLPAATAADYPNPLIR